MDFRPSTMENLVIRVMDIFNGIYSGKKVLVTGHTGFKGTWLSIWLDYLGAEVVGYALPPDTHPSIFETTGLAKRITHLEGDVRNYEELQRVIHNHKPDMVFHLAAQPLVRVSYAEPRYTYETNIMGTVNLLEAIRNSGTVRVCTVITSDKCYENQEWVYSYRENDPLGGFDPYSSSKAGSELIVGTYQRSYCNANNIALASARAGNVIGGGDWALDRLVPDAVRALAENRPILVRNPQAVRPWQFVLEPLSGYLWLGSQMWDKGIELASAWNFGPNDAVILNVGELTTRLIEKWGNGSWQDQSNNSEQSFHEALYLQLDCSKSRRILGWSPVYQLEEAISSTVDWYQNFYNNPNDDMYGFTLKHINEYVGQARKKGLAWTGTGDNDER